MNSKKICSHLPTYITYYNQKSKKGPKEIGSKKKMQKQKRAAA